jgi:hypothetical protein
MLGKESTNTLSEAKGTSPRPSAGELQPKLPLPSLAWSVRGRNILKSTQRPSLHARKQQNQNATEQEAIKAQEAQAQ